MGRNSEKITVNNPSTSLVENVSSFLQGVRATFRQENVIVRKEIRSKRSIDDGVEH